MSGAVLPLFLSGCTVTETSTGIWGTFIYEKYQRRTCPCLWRHSAVCHSSKYHLLWDHTNRAQRCDCTFKFIYWRTCVVLRLNKALQLSYPGTPINGSHMNKVMFYLISMLRIIAGDNQMTKLIDIFTHGAANMVGSFSGAVTRLQNFYIGTIYRIWCRVYQLDLAVQFVISSHIKSTFNNPLIAIYNIYNT